MNRLVFFFINTHHIKRIEDEAGIEFKETTVEEIKSQGKSSKSSSSGSLLSNQKGFTTYTLNGKFDSKGQAYKLLSDCFSKTLLDSMKGVKLIRYGKGVCFDLNDDMVTDLEYEYKKAYRNGLEDFKLERTKYLPVFE